MSIDPVERRLEQSFEAERWTRFIQDCQDLEQLRETALALVQQLAQQKAASAWICLLYTSPSPRDRTRSRMPSSA